MAQDNLKDPTKIRFEAANDPLVTFNNAMDNHHVLSSEGFLKYGTPKLLVFPVINNFWMNLHIKCVYIYTNRLYI